VNSQTKFRTHSEMHDIYVRRHKQGLDDAPYMLRYEDNVKQKLLMYCGTHHSNNPRDPGYDDVLAAWDEFISSKNPHKIVLCEGRVRNVSGMSRDQAIITNADSGLACWFAQSQNLPCISPEPEYKEEIRELVKTHGEEKTLLYYFGRQMLQWARGDFATEPNWKQYAEEWLKGDLAAHFPERTRSLSAALKIFEQETKKQFSWSELMELYKISSPTDNPVSSHSGAIRDETIFAAIESYWRQDCSIFIIYGSGHAIIHEPALDTLCENSIHKA
jgi:hypothetical protein